MRGGYRASGRSGGQWNPASTGPSDSLGFCRNGAPHENGRLCSPAPKNACFSAKTSYTNQNRQRPLPLKFVSIRGEKIRPFSALFADSNLHCTCRTVTTLGPFAPPVHGDNMPTYSGLNRVRKLECAHKIVVLKFLSGKPQEQFAKTPIPSRPIPNPAPGKPEEGCSCVGLLTVA